MILILEGVNAQMVDLDMLQMARDIVHRSNRKYTYDEIGLISENAYVKSLSNLFALSQNALAYLFRNFTTVETKTSLPITLENIKNLLFGRLGDAHPYLLQ